jgi:hypothetical protein
MCSLQQEFKMYSKEYMKNMNISEKYEKTTLTPNKLQIFLSMKDVFSCSNFQWKYIFVEVGSSIIVIYIHLHFISVK